MLKGRTEWWGRRSGRVGRGRMRREGCQLELLQRVATKILSETNCISISLVSGSSLDLI